MKGTEPQVCYLLLGSTGGLQVAQQHLPPLPQRCLQLLEAAPNLCLGLSPALPQLPADLGYQPHSCCQLWEPGETRGPPELPNHQQPHPEVPPQHPHPAVVFCRRMWALPEPSNPTVPTTPSATPPPEPCVGGIKLALQPVGVGPRGPPETPCPPYLARTASSWCCRAALCCSSTSRSGTVRWSRCSRRSPSVHSRHMAVSQGSQ